MKEHHGLLFFKSDDVDNGVVFLRNWQVIVFMPGIEEGDVHINMEQIFHLRLFG